MTLKYTGSHIPNFKNSKLASVINGKPIIITDPKKQNVMKKIINEFGKYSKMPNGSISAKITFMVSDKRKRDLDGMICTTMDCLTRSGVISDDNIYVINSICSNVEFVEKGNEGCIIELLNNSMEGII